MDFPGKAAYDKFIRQGIMDGVDRGGYPEIIYYTESGRYFIWKIKGHMRWAGIGQTTYESSEYTLSDIKDWETKDRHWGGSSLEKDTQVKQTRSRLNKEIVAEWEKVIGEKLIKLKKPKKEPEKVIEEKIETNELDMVYSHLAVGIKIRKPSDVIIFEELDYDKRTAIRFTNEILSYMPGGYEKLYKAILAEELARPQYKG